jgi:hypothetical protein
VFAFLAYGVSVTRTRIDILTNNIRKKSGKIIDVETIDWNSSDFYEVTILTASDITKEVHNFSTL